MTRNVDSQEIDKFAELASRWWDPAGEFRPLHDINPLRLDYIEQHSQSLAGKKVLDIGCGGGILAEGMAKRGARVIGIDLGEAQLEVAKMHLMESGLEVGYQKISAEELAKLSPGTFDVITCMEMLEHVPDPASIIKSCRELAKPGADIFFSTINRNPKSYLFAIIGAEYLLQILPKGTHDYKKFIKPSELDGWIRDAGLTTMDITGMTYSPFGKNYYLGKDIAVNYLAYTQKPDVG